MPNSTKWLSCTLIYCMHSPVIPVLFFFRQLFLPASPIQQGSKLLKAYYCIKLLENTPSAISKFTNDGIHCCCLICHCKMHNKLNDFSFCCHSFISRELMFLDNHPSHQSLMATDLVAYHIGMNFQIENSVLRNHNWIHEPNYT